MNDDPNTWLTVVQSVSAAIAAGAAVWAVIRATNAARTAREDRRQDEQMHRLELLASDLGDLAEAVGLYKYAQPGKTISYENLVRSHARVKERLMRVQHLSMPLVAAIVAKEPRELERDEPLAAQADVARELEALTAP